jgi:ABC-type sugar transport system substrate-binding protein
MALGIVIRAAQTPVRIKENAQQRGRAMATQSLVSRRSIVKLVGVTGLGLGLSPLAACAPAPVATSTSTSNANALTGGQQKKRVVFLQLLEDPIVAQIQLGTYAFAKLRGWDFTVTGPKAFDPAQELSALEQAVSSKPDAILMIRVDTTTYNEAIKTAQSQGTYVQVVNQEQGDEESLGLPIVKTDLFGGGYLCGQQICQYSQQITNRKDGVIIGANFAPDAPFQIKRVGGLKKAVEDYNRANGTTYTVTVEKVSDDAAQAFPVFDTILRRDGSKIVGWAFTGFGWVNCANWIQQNNHQGKFANGGLDEVKAGLPSIKQDFAQFTVGEAGYAQGFMGGANVDLVTTTGLPGTTMPIALNLIDKSNVDKAIGLTDRLESTATQVAQGNWR